MNIIKVCAKPWCPEKYKKTDPEFKSDYCKCGGMLLEKKIETGGAIEFELQLNNDNIAIDSISDTRSQNIIDIEIEDNDIDEVDRINIERPRNSYEEVEEYGKVAGSEKSTIFTVDDHGFIHFIDVKENEELNEDKLVIYLSNKIYKEIPLEYDETIIGRHSVSYDPDVDLSPIDPESYTSRKHLMIYRQSNKFYARNLSTKNSVHIENYPLANGEDKELNDNDLIILSKYVVMLFKKKNIGSY